jgi:CBS domain-containing protein
MEIREAMITPVRTLPASATIADAARLMAEHDIGAVPVVQGEEILGIVTDRDITIRAMATGLDPALPVVRVMTHDVATCPDISLLDDVLDAMVTHGVRRMPIRSGEGKLVGIVSLSDLARLDWDKEQVGQTFADTCGTRHLQERRPAGS